MNLYLDDLRIPPNTFELAINVEEAINKYLEIKPKVLSLDHDLGYDKTGYDFTLWLVESYFNDNTFHLPDSIYLHTSNPVGRANMFQLLTRYLPSNVKVYNSPIVSYAVGTGEYLD